VPRNLELKARLPDPEAALRRARAVGSFHALEKQIDTYFRVPVGRLKLRRRWAGGDPGEGTAPAFSAEWSRLLPSELISYRRADAAEPRPSDYRIVRVDDGEAIVAGLGLAVGVDVVVEKVRIVFLYERVRIHLDDVTDLGSFVELEAIVDASCDEKAATGKVRCLREQLGISDADLVAVSYRELLRSAKADAASRTDRSSGNRSTASRR
jgi:adenylate cyclase class IV